MLGQDVKYANELDDKKLIEIAKTEKRILLTKDLGLYQQTTGQHVDAFIVEGENEAERLAVLSKRFGLNLEFDPSNSRCPKCNDKIKAARKADVSETIPEATRKFYEEFWKCPKCGKIYWQGAHWKRISKTLDEAEKIAEKI